MPFRIYFDPSYHPDYFYPLIKPLTLIYDQIIIWSPVASLLEERARFPLDDFIAACTPTDDEPPALVPAGRERWFDAAWRRSYPDPSRRRFDRAFEGRLRVAAERAHTILPTDYEKGYRIVDEIWEADRDRVGEVAEGVGRDLPESPTVVIQRVAEERRKPFAWAVVNSYAQDIVAVHALGDPPPLVRPEQARGYLCLTPPETQSQPLAALRQSLPLRQPFPDLPRGITVEEVRRFLDEAWEASNVPWAEVRELRKQRKALRTWLNDALERRRRPLSAQSLSDIATLRARKLERDAAQLAKASLEGPLIIGASVLGPDLANLLVVIAVLSYFRFKTPAPLSRLFAKLLGGKDRILVDTPFFVDAELKRDGKS